MPLSIKQKQTTTDNLSHRAESWSKIIEIYVFVDRQNAQQCKFYING